MHKKKKREKRRKENSLFNFTIHLFSHYPQNFSSVLLLFLLLSFQILLFWFFFLTICCIFSLWLLFTAEMLPIFFSFDKKKKQQKFVFPKFLKPLSRLSTKKKSNTAVDRYKRYMYHFLHSFFFFLVKVTVFLSFFFPLLFWCVTFPIKILYLFI